MYEPKALADYTPHKTTDSTLDGIRGRVRASIEGIEAGKFFEYEGREGLKKLRDGVKARCRKLLARKASGK
jgi:hypothetical protein